MNEEFVGGSSTIAFSETHHLVQHLLLWRMTHIWFKAQIVCIKWFIQDLSIISLHLSTNKHNMGHPVNISLHAIYVNMPCRREILA